jgi:hypothetical protein
MRKMTNSVGFAGAICGGRMRPLGVVLDAPVLDGDLNPEQGVALFDGRQLVSEGTSAGLDSEVSHGELGSRWLAPAPAKHHAETCGARQA